MNKSSAHFSQSCDTFGEFKLPKLKDPSAIVNRLPNTVFTGNQNSRIYLVLSNWLITTIKKKGPNSLRDQRVIVNYDSHDVGHGPFSKLRTYDTQYITR